MKYPNKINMITQIENLAAIMIGFNDSNDVTKEYFTNLVMPKVKELVSKTDNLNYMLVLNTSVKNFTAAA